MRRLQIIKLVDAGGVDDGRQLGQQRVAADVAEQNQPVRPGQVVVQQHEGKRARRLLREQITGAVGSGSAHQPVAHLGARRRVDHAVEVVIGVLDHEHRAPVGVSGVHGVSGVKPHGSCRPAGWGGAA